MDISTTNMNLGVNESDVYLGKNLWWNKNNDGQSIAEKADDSDHWKENSFHQPKADKICELSQKTRPSITHHSNCLHSKMSSALPQFKLPLNNISCLKEKFIYNVNRKRLNVSLEEEHTIVAIKLSTLQINLCCNNL